MTFFPPNTPSLSAAISEAAGEGRPVFEIPPYLPPEPARYKGPIYRRVPGYGKGRYRYYRFYYEPNARVPKREEISQYRYRQNLKALSPEERLDYNRIMREDVSKRNRQRVTLAENYQRMLQSNGVSMSIGAILRDRQFNALATMLSLRSYELMDARPTDPRNNPGFLYPKEHIPGMPMPTDKEGNIIPGSLGAAQSFEGISIRNMGANGMEAISEMNRAQLLVALGMRRPGDNHPVGLSAPNYVATQMVPYFTGRRL